MDVSSRGFVVLQPSKLPKDSVVCAATPRSVFSSLLLAVGLLHIASAGMGPLFMEFLCIVATEQLLQLLMVTILMVAFLPSLNHSHSCYVLICIIMSRFVALLRLIAQS